MLEKNVLDWCVLGVEFCCQRPSMVIRWRWYQPVVSVGVVMMFGGVNEDFGCCM